MDPASTTAAPPVVAWHAASAREAGSQLGVGLGGLDGAEAERRLRAVGSNVIHARRGEPAVRVLVRQLTSPLIVVLLGAGVMALALGELADGVVVLAVVVVNTAIGFAAGVARGPVDPGARRDAGRATRRSSATGVAQHDRRSRRRARRPRRRWRPGDRVPPTRASSPHEGSRSTSRR